MLISGRCHCGNIAFTLDWTPDPVEIPARACTCTFCTRHGGVWTSCPTGSLNVTVQNPRQVSHYAFGTHTAQFHVCAQCGVTPVVTSLIDEKLYAVVNVNTFENVEPSRLRRSPSTLDEETGDERLERRKRNWIADVTLNTAPQETTPDTSAVQQSLAHVALVVRDYDEAIDFYTQKLGFTVVEDSYQPAQDKRWVVIAPPGSQGTSLLLARASQAEQESFVGNQAGGRVFLFLRTDDFWRDYHRMSAVGVRFARPPSVEAYGTVAVFEDLYGNRWDLLEYSRG
jgi:catechol 2,3-dioxygenase-like lactoylglutathione lyase family enzyme